MRKFVLGFTLRGLTACGFGPMVLAVLYLILQQQGIVQMLTVEEVCVGIFSLAILAFVTGGLNELYQIERLPLLVAILIHGGALYVCYLAAYLVNGWLEWGMMPVIVFSAIFAVGYLVIWAVIYSVMKYNTEKLNDKLTQNNRMMPHDQGR